MEVYSLYDLNQYIQQVIALNFADSIWITCELSQVSMHRSNCYLDLIEKNENSDEVKAQSSAAIWGREFSFIKKKLGNQVEKILQPGMTVKLKVEVDFNVRYGMKLIVKDIDPSYTFGQLALIREQIIERLRKEDRLDLNKQIAIPSVIQNIAVISSTTAAGYKDLTEHLKKNPYGYAFQIKLFPAAMQGNRVEMEVIDQLREIRKQPFDIVIITRGGGSKLDLSGFDSYHIAKEISEYPYPVFTGIGHEIDESIADLASSKSFKTPTAVANYIIDHNVQFMANMLDMAVKINLIVKDKIRTIDSFLSTAQQRIQEKIANIISNQHQKIDNISDQLPYLIKNQFDKKHNQLELINTFVQANNPNNILKKGYSIVRNSEGKSISSISELDNGEIITNTFYDGKVLSNINTIIKNEE